MVGLLDIYAAGEKKINNINSKRLARMASKKNKKISYWGNLTAASQKIKPLLKSNDIFLTLGAGDVWKLGAELLKK